MTLERRATGPRRPLRAAAPWLLGALLLSALGLPAAAGAFGHLSSAPTVGYARPLSSVNVTVNLTDAPRFDPQYISVAAGTNATFHLVNQGSFDHTFTLLKQPNARLNSSWTPSQVDRFIAQNGSLANVSLAPNATGDVSVDFNASTGFDSFEFASIVPYQFQAGMFGFVNITSTAPGLSLSENTTDQFQFQPSVLAASPVHYPVNLDVLVTNTGNFAHTFTMAPQSNVTLSPANFTAYFQLHHPLVNVNLGSGSGTTVWANFTVLAPGVYQYICEVPGHFASGMDGFLYVGVPAPPPAAPPSTAIVQGWVLAGSAVLLGIGALVAAAAAFTGRFPPRVGGSHP